MSEVLIKGMEMPRTCDMCWALDDYGDYPRCRITGEQRGYNFRVREKRMDRCPLIEIQSPYGRLGDLDALTNRMKDWNPSILAVINAQPLIIKAEGNKQ